MNKPNYRERENPGAQADGGKNADFPDVFRVPINQAEFVPFRSQVIGDGNQENAFYRSVPFIRMS